MVQTNDIGRACRAMKTRIQIRLEAPACHYCYYCYYYYYYYYNNNYYYYY